MKTKFDERHVIPSALAAWAASVAVAVFFLGGLASCSSQPAVSPAAMFMRGAIYDPSPATANATAARAGVTSPTLRVMVELGNQGATGPAFLGVRWPVQGEFRGHMSLAATPAGATATADMSTSKTAKTSIWTKALGVAGTIAGYAYGKTS